MGNKYSKDISKLKNINPNTINKRTFNNKTRFCYVKSVYDGDTITIITNLYDNEIYESYSLRLLGIDAPEIKPLKIIANRDNHIKASKIVKKILEDRILNKLIVVDFNPEEKYGRLLGTIYEFSPLVNYCCCFGKGSICKNIDNINDYKGENINEWLFNIKCVKKFDPKRKKDDFTGDEVNYICKTYGSYIC